MSVSGDRSRQEKVIGRLRELHAAATDEDRPRAALYLGLAIADLIPSLPDDDLRRHDLAGEGLARLDESADASPATTSARQLLAACRATSEGPESFQFTGGDLHWDLDWEALRGPTEAARQLTATLPVLTSMLPAEAPLRRALTDIADVLGAFDRGQWSPEYDATLTSAIQQVEAGGLGAGLGVMLRMVAMVIRVHRCRLAEQDGRQPNWPPLTEFDNLIDDMEAADELGGALGGPFGAVDGLHHLYIGGVIMMRLYVDTRKRDVPRDAAWRERTLRLLDKADDHLRQTPVAYSGPVQHMHGNLARVSADLRRAGPLPTASAPAPSPSPAPAPSRPPQPPPVPAERETSEVPAEAGPPGSDPAETAVTGTVADHPAAPSWSLDGPFSQFASPEIVAGFRMLAEATGSPVMTAVTQLTSVLPSALARRWTSEADQGLAALRQEADRLETEPEAGLSDRAVVAAMLAMARVTQWNLKSADPQPTERPAASEAADVIAEVEAALQLLSAAAAQSPSVPVFAELQGPLHAQAAMLLTDLGRADGGTPDAGLIARARDHMAQVPPEMLDQMPPVVRDVFLLQRIVADNSPPDADDAERLAARFRELMETTGGDLTNADTAASRARQSRNPADIGTAISELNKAGIALPAGSPLRSRVLSSLAEMQTLLAMHTGYPLALGDAAGAAIEALRVASGPAEKKSAIQRLIVVFSLMIAMGRYDGPLDEAEQLLRGTLGEVGPGDWPLRVIATVGIGAAAGVRAAGSDDQKLRAEAVRLITEAERLLPDAVPDDDWYGAARILYTWTTVHALHDAYAELAPVALRVIDQLEEVALNSPQGASHGASETGGASAGDTVITTELETLREGRARLLAAAEQPPADESRGKPRPAPDPEDARRLARHGLDRSAAVLGGTGPDGLPRRPLAATARPQPASLRGAMTDLHGALAGPAGDLEVRRQIDEALGRCAAELYWADPEARTVETLREAAVHLNRALASGEHGLPATARADLLDVLARCQHEVALHFGPADRERAQAEAKRAARAAVRELARCVLLTEDTGQALEVAARANEIVARTVGWCVADGEDRAAVEMAEAGRGLVLAGVVLAGRVEEVLRGAGRPDVADAWQQGSAAGRAAGLDALWDTSVSATLLAAPTVDEVSVMLAATRADAVVYLVPPAAPDADGPDDSAPAASVAGHAVLVRPLAGTVEVVALPGLSGQDSAPLHTYLAALDDAIASFDPGTGDSAGFRGGASGQAWADALERLGEWAYERIVGPLIGHVRGWKLNRLPHLVLIPLGDLAAIPYSASWTATGAPPHSRRYAIDDVVLTYAASARLLGDVSRRPRQPLTERVVLVSDPTGQFPMARRTVKELASRQYPGAEVYGPRNAPNGPATTAVLLDALPGRDRPGASLFQLSTHATTMPTPQLQTRDGWLPISRILDQARDRPPNAPGGLIITNACLTDSTRANYDESLTLATAFLAAGATSVIGTRWPVDDDTAAALSLRLHYHLQLGKLPAEALRNAQLDLARPTPDIRSSLGPILAAVAESRLSHPASWAGHVHHGISSGLKEHAAVPDAAPPDDLPDDPLLRALATHWADLQGLADAEQQNRLRALAADMGGPDAAEARAELADELIDLLPADHPVIAVLRSGTMLVKMGEATGPARMSTATGTMPVTIYLSDEQCHPQVEQAVEKLLATGGLIISEPGEPIIGSWFRRMTASLKVGLHSPVAHDAAVTAAHAADSRWLLAQDATVTATLLHNVGPVLQSLQPTRDAVIRAGALLIVKVDWTVNVIQLTAAQQFQLDHRPQLACSPQEIMTLLNLVPADEPGAEQTRQLSSPPGSP
ncbi:MAG: CHAT domain-containing protein [Streptosporangiaceae bacterium]